MAKIPQEQPYDAFISHSHTGKDELAHALREALHKFGKPFWRTRALKVFLDDSSLSATPALKESILAALIGAKHCILLASPESATSRWVAWELDNWRRNNDISRMIIVLVAGEIEWNPRENDFDWTTSTALPDQLADAFDEEPRWIDMRWAHDLPKLSLEHHDFRDTVAEIAAPLHNKPKDELVGEDLREARRLRIVGRTIFAFILLLAIALGILGQEWRTQRNTAQQQRDSALRNQSLYLADQSRRLVAGGAVEQGLLLALEAVPDQHNPRPYVPEAEAALYSALLAPTTAHKIAHLDTEGDWEYATFSPNGKFLATLKRNAADHSFHIWEAATGKLLHTLNGHQGSVIHAEFSPDSQLLVTAALDRTARLWRVASGEQLRVFRPHDDAVYHAEFGPQGKILASASLDGAARLWDVETGELLNTFRLEGREAYRAQFSPRGDRLLVLSVGTEDPFDDVGSHLWDINTAKIIAKFSNQPFAIGHPMAIRMPTLFSPDGKWVVTATKDGAAQIWQTSDGRPLGRLRGHQNTISHIQFSADGNWLATASLDGSIRVWPMRQDIYGRFPSADESRVLRFKPQLDIRFRAPLQAVAFSPDQRYLASAGSHGSQLWNPFSGRLISNLGDSIESNFVTAAPTGGRLLTFHQGGATLWGLPTNTSAQKLAHGSPIKAIAITPNSRFIATGGIEGRIALWDSASGARVSLIEAHTSEISAIAVSPRGYRMLSAASEPPARIWSVPDGKSITELHGHNGRIHSSSFCPDRERERALTVSNDGTAMLWDTATGTDLKLLGSTEDPVISAAFDKNGRRFLTLSQAGTILIYE